MTPWRTVFQCELSTGRVVQINLSGEFDSGVWHALNSYVKRMETRPIEMTQHEPRPFRVGDCVEWFGMKGVIESWASSEMAWVVWRDHGKDQIRYDHLKHRDCDCDDRPPDQTDGER